MALLLFVGKNCLHNLFAYINDSNLKEVSMTNLIKSIKKEQEYLEQIRSKAEEDIKQDQKDKLTGKLRIQRKGNSVQYYHTETEHTEKVNQSYISKKNIELARNLAQRDYDNRLIQEIGQRLKLLNRFIKEYPHEKLEEIYNGMNDYRKELIHPIIETDEQYAKIWLNTPYIRKTVGEDVPVIFTENGERVRSKSEKMIADKLKQFNIPYRYEAPLRLERSTVIHPDFTVLNVRTRKEYYYEHFGMMDNIGYMDSALKRIKLYEENGIFPGDRLLFSWETMSAPLNMKMVEAKIKKFLL